MQTMTWREPAQLSLDLKGIPPGNARRVEAEIASAEGDRLYQGSATVNLGSGENRLEMELGALFVELSAVVPLGLQNQLGIAGGELRLVLGSDTLRSALSLVAGSGSFSLSRVPFSEGWVLEVELWNASGVDLYRYSGNYPVGPGTSPELALDLSALQTDLQLKVMLNTPPNPHLLLLPPGSRTRAPATAGEVLFSEFLANPKVSGDAWEWMELHNTTRDTLLLRGCAVGKSRGSTAASTWLPLPDTLRIPPADFRVLGRDSVPVVDWRYSSFALSNTRQTLLVLCGELAVDSLLYNPPEDTLNPFPIAEGRSVQLRLDSWQQRNLGTSWCQSADSVAMGAGWVVPGSPGWAGSCRS